MMANRIALCGALLSLQIAVDAGAGLVRTIEGRLIEGEVGLGTNGSFVVKREGAKPVTVPLTHMVRVQLANTAEALASGGFHAEGWAAEDVGSVSLAGSTGWLDGKWYLRGGGGFIGEEEDGCHFVSTRISGNCELLARVTQVHSTDRLGRAGIMLRETPQGRSRFAALLVKADGTLSFRGRADWGKSDEVKFTQPAPMPGWVKLRKQQSQITAFKSTDGRQWESLGQMTVPIEREFHAGLAIANRNASSPCTATLEGMELTVNGVLGEYFADAAFRHRILTRIDPQLDFAWGLEAPDERIGKENFSVRWTGQIEPKYSENHLFYFDADETAQLWVNGQEMPPRTLRSDAATEGAGMAVQAGKRYDFKLEYRSGSGSARARLGWSSRSQAMEVIPAGQLFCAVIPRTSPPRDRPQDVPRSLPLKRGVLLRSGTFLTGSFTATDDEQVKLRRPDGNDLLVFWHQIAWIVFRPWEKVTVAEMGVRTGVLMQDGQWFEGAIRGIHSRKLMVSSVLYGIREFHPQQADVAVWLLKPFSAVAAPFEIHMVDGSVLLAQNLTVASDALVLAEPILGDVRVAMATVREISRRR